MRIGSLYGPTLYRNMPRTCPVCGVTFWIGEEWAYKTPGKCRYTYFCSWKCLRQAEKEGKFKSMSSAKKLTPEEKAKIGELFEQGLSANQIAGELERSESSIQCILCGLRRAKEAEQPEEPAAPCDGMPSDAVPCDGMPSHAIASDDDTQAAPKPAAGGPWNRYSAPEDLLMPGLPTPAETPDDLFAREILRICGRVLDLVEMAIKHKEEQHGD